MAKLPADIVRDRRQMAGLLGERMAGSYGTLREDQRLAVDTSLVKSYLVESSIREDESVDGAQSAAFELLNHKALGPRIDLVVHRVDDPSLLNIEASVATRQRTQRVVAYVDLSNPRFWQIHSMGGSDAIDLLVDRLVQSGPDLDRAWLPADLLEWISTVGGFRGLGLDYDRRPIPDVDFNEAPGRVEFLKMQLWGNRAADVLGVLRATGAFPNETTLAKVRVKFAQDPQDLDQFSLDDVKYDGKVTARGTSFESHVGLLADIYDRYGAAVRQVEDSFGVGADPEAAHREVLRITGQPITFRFDPAIPDVGTFCSYVFSSRGPFRLWGVPIRLYSDYYRVEAVDLHVGRPIRAEIAPEFLRLYVPAGTCGNSALRLYTNLQHHYNSRIRAVHDDDRAVFHFQ